MTIFCGIYTITNKINGRVYIGRSINIKQRFNRHRRSLDLGEHYNEYLQRAWNKYGGYNFAFEVLEEYPEDLLQAMEHYWVTILRALESEFGYNIKPTHPYIENLAAFETKVKMSASFWNNRDREEHSKKLSILFKGRKAPWREGKQSSEYIEKRMKSIRKAIIQKDLNGNFIKEWDSAKKCELDTGFTSDYISQACRGLIPKFKGYLWEFKK